MTTLDFHFDSVKENFKFSNKVARCQQQADSTEVLVLVPIATSDWIHIPALLLGVP